MSLKWHLFCPFSRFSSELRREALETLRKEVDQLKTRLRESRRHTRCSCIDSTGLRLSYASCCPTKQRPAQSCSHHVRFICLLTGRQEEDTLLQQGESRETRRQYERSCKVQYTPYIITVCLQVGLNLSDLSPLLC